MPKTRNVPATTISKIDALIAGFNEMVTALALAGEIPHHAPTAVVSTADASSLATSIALANALKAAYEAHRVDTGAHVAADSTNTISAATATDLASTQTLLNELKTDINAHLVLEASHRGISRVGGYIATIATADGSDLTTTQALANALKAALNREAGGALITSPNAADQTTANTLANEIKRVLNTHLAAGVSSIVVVAS